MLALAAAGALALAAPAAAAPCGNAGGSGSSLLPSFGSSSSGSGSSPGSGPRGPQGPLPRLFGGNTQTVSWVTGPLSQNMTLDRFGISGTDLGISWDNGMGQTLMAFGDTFGNCDAADQEWRHNVLLRSKDDVLADGISVPDATYDDIASGSVVTQERPKFAQQLIDALGVDYVEVAAIPTTAISVGNEQYLNYMSVRAWGDPGHWDTNFSAIAVSNDNGQTWHTDPMTIRVNANVTIPDFPQVHADNGKFQMNAYVKGNDGYIYQYGTPNGRFGNAYLARVLPANILKLSEYEYYTNDDANRWSKDFGNLKAVLSQPVSEMSAAWNDYLQKYIVLYGTTGATVIRTADRPEGPFSAPKTLFNAAQLGGVYAPFVHPASKGKDLYFTASSWEDYNVMLLRTDLAKIR